MLDYSPSLDARSETLGAVTGTSTNTTITAGTSNAKGSWATIGTSAFRYQHLHVFLTRPSAAADYLVDIGVDDGAGNTWIVAADLRQAGYGTNAMSITYPLPLAFPSGAVIRARCSSSTNNATIGVALVGQSNNLGGAPGCSRLVALYTPASSRGTDLNAGGTANTKVSYTQLIASSSNRVCGILGFVGSRRDTARASTTTLWDIGVGSATAEHDIVSNLPLSEEATGDTAAPQLLGPFWREVASGSRFGARVQSTSTTDVNYDFALWGLVP